MTPRGPAARTAAATSSAVRGTTTRALVGAVRPQPLRLVVLDIVVQITRGEIAVGRGPPHGHVRRSEAAVDSDM